MAHDVFISHAVEDKEVANAICSTLEARGIRCWIAPRDVQPGRDWGASLISAINKSRAMVLVFSAHANKSHNITRELNHAIDKGVPVIPFRIEDVMPSETMEYYLDVVHWLDALTIPRDARLQDLADKVELLLNPTTSGADLPSLKDKPPPEPPPPPPPPRAVPVVDEPRRSLWEKRKLLLGVAAAILLAAVALVTYLATRRTPDGPRVIANSSTPSDNTSRPANLTTTQTPIVAVNPKVTPAPPPSSEPSAKSQVLDVMAAWTESIKKQDLDGTLSLYADKLDHYYGRPQADKSKVRATLQGIFSRNNISTNVKLSDISVEMDPSGTKATATYINDYDWKGNKEFVVGKSKNKMVLSKTGTRWLITSEEVVEQYPENKGRY